MSAICPRGPRLRWATLLSWFSSSPWTVVDSPQLFLPSVFLLRKKKEKKKGKKESLKLKVGEAAGVFLVVSGNGENRLVELVVAKLLKRDGGCDCRKDGDVCKGTRVRHFRFGTFALLEFLICSTHLQFNGPFNFLIHLNNFACGYQVCAASRMVSAHRVWQESRGEASSEQTPWVY